jgi:hypothetical protein
MATHPDKGFPHQPIAFGHGGVGMPSTKHPFLGIYPTFDCGDGEAGSISGHRGIGNVRRFEAEVNLRKLDGVHCWNNLLPVDLQCNNMLQYRISPPLDAHDRLIWLVDR